MKQEFGPEDICIWMPEQKQIIDEARAKFQDGDRLEWMVQGCAGSGKTLILKQLVKEFLESGSDT